MVIAYPQGNWYRVPSTEHARTLVQDLHHESLYNEHVFTLREGTLQRTAQTTAIKGSKGERGVTTWRKKEKFS